MIQKIFSKFKSVRFHWWKWWKWVNENLTDKQYFTGKQWDCHWSWLVKLDWYNRFYWSSIISISLSLSEIPLIVSWIFTKVKFPLFHFNFFHFISIFLSNLNFLLIIYEVGENRRSSSYLWLKALNQQIITTNLYKINTW